jgi:phage gp36-like protein
MATPYLSVGDFISHLYPEIVSEITRDYVPGDEGSSSAIATTAINEAIAEAKSYLSRFDLVKLFGNADTDVAVEDENLKSKVKDIAVWRMVRLANPNVSMELARTNYEDAIKWLSNVQKGICDPEGWPYKPTELTTPLSEGTALGWSSNQKRRNHF